MDIQQISINDIFPYLRNAKKHDQRQIDNVAESIKQFGIVQPIVVDKDNNIIIGHCRALACKKLNIETVPVVKLEDLTPEEANKLRLLDNKLNESEWDFDLLAEDIPELDFSGFDIDWGLPEENIEVKEDEAPEPPEEPKSKLGQLYKLGRHRLLCGDATKPEDVLRLMGDQKADLYLTDPPYNVALGMGGSVDDARKRHRRTDGLVIMNDKMGNDDFRKFLTESFSCAKQVMKAGAAFYIWHADNEGYNFRGAMQDAGFELRQTLIWKKNTITLGRQDFQWMHEPCLYGWNDGASHSWYSNRKQSTVLEFDKPSKSDLHPTMKPVKLFNYLILVSTKSGDIVFDSFGGSGTTIMACEQNDRCGYCLELDPRYVDAIIQRWENFTGQKAELIGEFKNEENNES